MIFLRPLGFFRFKSFLAYLNSLQFCNLPWFQLQYRSRKKNKAAFISIFKFLLKKDLGYCMALACLLRNYFAVSPAGLRSELVILKVLQEMVMKKTICLTAILVLTAIGSSLQADDKIEFEITADYFGKYIWRGQNLSDDPVFQPGISATYNNFTAGVWGNLETTSINNNSGEFTEWDYYLDYSNSLPGVDGVGYSVGIINYHFPSVVGD